VLNESSALIPAVPVPGLPFRLVLGKEQEEKMFVLGQALNLLDERIYRAVRQGDGDTISGLAVQQIRDGADGLDICLGNWNRCGEVLPWIVKQVRKVSECPLFLPPCPEGLPPSLKAAGPGSFINCVTADASQLRSMFSAAESLDASLVVLLTRKGYLPATLDEICLVAEEVLELAEKQGFPIERLVLDPVIRPRTGCFSWGMELLFPDITLFMEAIFLIGRLRDNKVKTMVALSNIRSFFAGHVNNSLQVQVLRLLSSAGLDFAMINTGNRELVAAAKQVNSEMNISPFSGSIWQEMLWENHEAPMVSAG